MRRLTQRTLDYLRAITSRSSGPGLAVLAPTAERGR